MALRVVFCVILPVVFAANNFVEVKDCPLDEHIREEIRSYQPIANKIIDAVTEGEFRNTTYKYLAEFIDKFGNRLTGTKNLENAIDYMLQKSQDFGLENVHGEEVTVPKWVRGYELGILLTPRHQVLRILGLGSSVGTPMLGLTANVIVVNSFSELTELGTKKIANKIVVFNPKWESYGKTAVYRTKGASEAAKFGAIAALVRSVTPFSLDTLHTGAQFYDKGVKQIPVACITPSDANMLQRMQERGENITIRLIMQDENPGDTTSRNTVAEIKGREEKDNVVIVSGHLDSWDVGQGAMDDGGGAFLSWNTMVLLKRLGLRPRRTMRVILWTGEEQGYVGSKQYGKNHRSEIDKLDFVMESDMGTFKPVGLEFSGNDEATCIMKEIMNLLAPINATRLRKPQDGGPDIEMWTNIGVPGASPWQENQNYFWYHHSGADTMDVEDPENLNLLTALWATVSYVVADLSIDLPKDLKPFKV